MYARADERERERERERDWWCVLQGAEDAAIRVCDGVLELGLFVMKERGKIGEVAALQTLVLCLQSSV